MICGFVALKGTYILYFSPYNIYISFMSCLLECLKEPRYNYLLNRGGSLKICENFFNIKSTALTRIKTYVTRDSFLTVNYFSYSVNIFSLIRCQMDLIVLMGIASFIPVQTVFPLLCLSFFSILFHDT